MTRRKRRRKKRKRKSLQRLPLRMDCRHRLVW